MLLRRIRHRPCVKAFPAVHSYQEKSPLITRYSAGYLILYGSLFYRTQCTIHYTVQCTQYTLHSTRYTTQYSVHSTLCTVHDTVHSTVYTVHSAQYTILYIVHSAQYLHDTMQVTTYLHYSIQCPVVQYHPSKNFKSFSHRGGKSPTEDSEILFE